MLSVFTPSISKFFDKATVKSGLSVVQLTTLQQKRFREYGIECVILYQIEL